MYTPKGDENVKVPEEIEPSLDHLEDVYPERGRERFRLDLCFTLLKSYLEDVYPERGRERKLIIFLDIIYLI